MKTELYTSVRRTMLKTLISKNKWGASHTHYKHMFSGIPKHLRGLREVKKAADDLFKEGKVMYKKTTSEYHISLNPVHAQEIKEEVYYTKKV